MSKPVQARRGHGFTMIELMIVVVIVAILAAIAAPLYSQYLVRGQRSAARAGLLQVAQAMERYYTATGSYQTATNAFPLAPPLTPYVGGTVDCIAVVPANATSSSGITYCISGSPPPPPGGSGFLLYATPCGATTNCGSGANSSFNDTDCGTLTLDNTGARGALYGGTGYVTSGPVVINCWSS
jgi:type IV pilus assembly protein PilE